MVATIGDGVVTVLTKTSTGVKFGDTEIATSDLTDAAKIAAQVKNTKLQTVIVDAAKAAGADLDKFIQVLDNHAEFGAEFVRTKYGSQDATSDGKNLTIAGVKLATIDTNGGVTFETTAPASSILTAAIEQVNDEDGLEKLLGIKPGADPHLLGLVQGYQFLKLVESGISPKAAEVLAKNPKATLEQIKAADPSSNFTLGNLESARKTLVDTAMTALIAVLGKDKLGENGINVNPETLRTELRKAFAEADKASSTTTPPGTPGGNTPVDQSKVRQALIGQVEKSKNALADILTGNGSEEAYCDAFGPITGMILHMAMGDKKGGYTSLGGSVSMLRSLTSHIASMYPFHPEIQQVVNDLRQYISYGGMAQTNVVDIQAEGLLISKKNIERISRAIS